MTIRILKPQHVDALGDMFYGLAPSDLTFIKEDVSTQAIASWPRAPGRRWVEVDEHGRINGFAALIPLTGWSDHVAELRLVVEPAVRGQGLGGAMARHAVAEGTRQGLLKVVVEVPAAQERIIGTFLSLGFTGEALLRDHFRDRNGSLQDLIMLAYLAEQTHDAVTVAGITELDDGR